ncbi:MAG: M43 family zinc metalloprotease [Spirosomaceae bacterium]|nr:M43 family zinc metalloprotease [Spirosomataceae bacterium]
MKNILILSLFILSVSSAIAQNQQPAECGTRILTPPKIFSQKEKDSLNAILAINVPYAVRLYVTVFANNDGSNRAAPDADIIRQVQNMANQYAAHNICFILIDIRQVNNTDLNTHNSDTEEAELNPYIISGCLNLFIHNYLDSNSGTLNGTAYAIPNTYMSMGGWAITPTDNISTMGHEAGHCFGLLHTFETFYGAENVTRNSGNACYDCTSQGDLLCDTPADPNGTVNSSCVYTGGANDACGVAYAPMTTNMMAYGFRPCRSLFTAGQGTRMRSFLTTTPSLTALIADDIVFRPSTSNTSITYTNGIRHETARDQLIISNYTGDSYTVSGSTDMNMVSKRVVLKPGTSLSPSTGRVHIKVNPYCN